MEAKVVTEDAVDTRLWKESGMIQQGPSANCRHNARSKCSYCLPLDPYDPGYLAAKEIKHMSFHAYMRKIKAGGTTGRSSVLSYPLENTACRVKECKNHAPYPAAICSKCQPDPIILARQVYRHVDNVSFESSEVVDEFLEFWRKSGGAQRVGILLGRYEEHPDVPLGIRASVSAIFEPPQISSPDKVAVEDMEKGPDSWLAALEAVSAPLGLSLVGWILTDLVQLPDSKFHFSRNPVTSYLVSAQECITAAHLQNLYPNATKLAHEGYFGSKFVTVIVSGDQEGLMEFRGWQMSNQAAALVKDKWLVPTAGLPDKAYVRDDERCVPDVKFTEKDEYGNNVAKDARPFPVEYLLVDVPAGLAASPRHSFNPGGKGAPRFPHANREAIRQAQSLRALARHLGTFGPDAESRLAAFSDFHLLYFLATNGTCAIPVGALAPLLGAVKGGDAEAVMAWMSNCEQWATLWALAEAESVGGAEGMDTGGAAGGEEWACKHCTLHNPAGQGDCSACGLPK